MKSHSRAGSFLLVFFLNFFWVSNALQFASFGMRTKFSSTGKNSIGLHQTLLVSPINSHINRHVRRSSLFESLNSSDEVKSDRHTTDPNSDSSSANKITAPSLLEIIKFAIPAIGIWLLGPLLSLIDTSAVGLLAGTGQLAALNPAITITDDGSLLVSFMYTASTNIIAAEFEKERIHRKGNKSTAMQMKNLLQLSSFVGLSLGLGIWTFSTFFIKVLLGGGHGAQFDTEVLTAAQRYVKIRALGMPAAVIIGTAQSACLGMKDTNTPLLVMMSAALVNLLGDFLFVGSDIPWIGGAAGAALATTFSQYAALVFFMKWLHSPPIPKMDAPDGTVNANHNRLMRPTSKGILHRQMTLLDLFQFPNCAKTLRNVFDYLIPVTTTSIGRISGYITMSHVVSSTFGTVHMAAQQIVLAFFLCFIPMCDSLNLTAQSFVPGIHAYVDDKRLRLEVMKKTIRNFLKAGGLFGIVLTAIVITMPFVSHLFSHDAAVIASVNSTTPHLAIMFALSGFVCAGEGLLLGQKDLSFLRNTFGVFFFVLPLWLMRIKHDVLTGVKVIGLDSVWRVFATYQTTRCLLWLARIFFLVKRDEKELSQKEICK